MKTEFFIAAIMLLVLTGLGIFVTTRSPGAEAATSTLRQFTEADFAAFDRDFELEGRSCAAGLERDRICFLAAPMERRVTAGMTLPPEIPVLPAEFRVIVATELKADHLQTVRFGRTLALINPETRRVEDVLRLTAETYEEARAPAPL